MKRAVALLSTALILSALPATSAAASVTTSGYVRMADGTELRYTLTRSAPRGSFRVFRR